MVTLWTPLPEVPFPTDVAVPLIFETLTSGVPAIATCPVESLAMVTLWTPLPEVPFPTGALRVDASGTNQPIDLVKINGVTASVKNGSAGSGVLRVTIANDSTGQVAISNTPDVNVAKIAGTVVIERGEVLASVRVLGQFQVLIGHPQCGTLVVVANLPIPEESNSVQRIFLSRRSYFVGAGVAAGASSSSSSSA